LGGVGGCRRAAEGLAGAGHREGGLLLAGVWGLGAVSARCLGPRKGLVLVVVVFGLGRSLRCGWGEVGWFSEVLGWGRCDWGFMLQGMRICVRIVCVGVLAGVVVCGCWSWCVGFEVGVVGWGWDGGGGCICWHCRGCGTGGRGAMWVAACSVEGSNS